jgi:hypothetical protein
MYAIGVQPLVEKLKGMGCIQIWYADDSSAGGRMRAVRKWLDRLVEDGPQYGYYPEPTKSNLVVKEGLEEEARAIFEGTGVNIVSASKFLGGFVGKDSVVREFMGEKIQKWVLAVECLAEVAEVYPQDAYAAFTKSLSCEWAYVQRTVPGSGGGFPVLDGAIGEKFCQALFGRPLELWERDNVQLSTKLGGLSLRMPSVVAEKVFEASARGVSVLVESIRSGEGVDVREHNDRLREVRLAAKAERERAEAAAAARVLESLPSRSRERRVVERAQREKTSSAWLSVLPLAWEGFDLSGEEFRDKLNMRHGRAPLNMPSKCDGCGQHFTIEHALSCKVGGNVKHGHDQLRDQTAFLLGLGFSGVRTEPCTQDRSRRQTFGQQQPQIRADISAYGVWERQQQAFFDNSIRDADAACRLQRNTGYRATMDAACREKKQKFAETCEDLRGSFTPLICTVDGVFHREYEALMKRLAARLASKWGEPYSKVMNWVRVRLQIALIRAVHLRIRSGRKGLHGIAVYGGSSLGLAYY